MYFFFSQYFLPFFFLFLIFSLLSPFAHSVPLSLHPQNLVTAQYGLRGARLGVSLWLLLRHCEDLLPLGAILHLVPLTTDKTPGWPLASLLSLLLLAFLFAFGPSFLSLATRVMWRSSLYNNHLATRRRARFPRKQPSAFLFCFLFPAFSSCPAPSLDCHKSTRCAQVIASSRPSGTLTPTEVFTSDFNPQTNSVYNSSSVIAGILYSNSRNRCTYPVTRPIYRRF